jgi:condensation domain-containing protein/phosphopantetheine binding protein
MKGELASTGATVAPLSSAQERLWLIDQGAPGSPAYNVPLLLRWAEPVDVTALRAALNVLVRRHDVLRTTYQQRGDQVVQVVAEATPVPVEVVGGRTTPGQVRADALRRARSGFDLANELPVRCVVWPDGNAVLLLIHHIAVDGWSLAPLFEELAQLYRAQELPPVGLRYVDYAAWERPQLDDLRQQLTRRADELLEVPTPLRLGGARAVAATPEGARPGRQVEFPVGTTHVQAAERLARESRTTPFVVFMAAYLETLRRWSGRTDFLVGTFTVNRPHAALERMVGFFVNTVPLRCHCGGTETFRELLTATRAEAFATLRLQRLPYDRLAATVTARGRRALPDVGFAYQNFPAPRLDTPPWRSELLPTGTAKADVLLIIDAAEAGTTGTLEFATDRYPEEFGDRFAADYQAVLAAALAEPDRRLSTVEIPYGPAGAVEPPAEEHAAGGVPAPRFERRAGELFHDALSTVDGLATGRVRAQDNFFALGGNSMLAVTMLARAGSAVTPREFLGDPTVAGLARLLERADGTETTRPAGEPTGERPATSVQQRMWLQDRMRHLRAAYLVPSVLQFDGDLDVDRLRDAVDTVLAHHPALRSRFRLDRAARRVVHTTTGEPARAEVTDVSAWHDDKLAEHLATLCWTPFDLAADAPARAEILCGDNGTLLVLCAHHIVVDGHSRQLLLDQIGAAYRGEPLPDPADPPPDEPGTGAAALVAALTGAPGDIALPHDRPRGPLQSVDAAAVRRRLDATRTARLRQVIADSGCSLFLATVTLTAATLARHGDQRDFLFVFPWSERPGQAVGMFVNTVPIRADLRGTPTWRDALRRVATSGAVGYRHADVPFDLVAAALQPERDLSRPPVTPVQVSAGTEPRPPDLGVPASLLALRPLKSKYELEFLALDAGDELVFELTYLTGLFDAATADDLADTLLAAATDLADHPRSLL